MLGRTDPSQNSFNFLNPLTIYSESGLEFSQNPWMALKNVKKSFSRQKMFSTGQDSGLCIQDREFGPCS